MADFPEAVAVLVAAEPAAVGKAMKVREFTDQLKDEPIVAAIAAAEQKSSGEIRVFIAHRHVDDVMAAAWKQFQQLGMEKTKNRNGVLLYFAPRARQFAVVGDQGIHEKCGPAFWQDVSTAMTHQLKQGKYTEAVVEAVTRVGDLLAQHFPPDPDNPNELSNEIVRG